MAIENYFDTEFSALKSTGIGDGIGGKTSGHDVDFTFYGTIDLVDGYRNMVAAQYKERATHVLLCPIGTALNSKHLIDDGISKWRILNIDDPVSRGHHLEIILEYIGVSSV